MTYMDKQTGEIFLTKTDMLEDFCLEYDGGDPTNSVTWDEYYYEMSEPKGVDAV